MGNVGNEVLLRGVLKMSEIGNNCLQALLLLQAFLTATWERKQLYYDFFFFKSKNIIAQGFGGQEKDLRLL